MEHQIMYFCKVLYVSYIVLIRCKTLSFYHLGPLTHTILYVLRLSQRCLWRMSSSGMWSCVGLALTDVSEERRLTQDLHRPHPRRRHSSHTILFHKNSFLLHGSEIITFYSSLPEAPAVFRGEYCNSIRINVEFGLLRFHCTSIELETCGYYMRRTCNKFYNKRLLHWLLSVYVI
jgi:hypothetical protein